MIERVQLFPLNFYKKEKFNGSDGKMCFRLAKAEVPDGEEKKTILLATVWNGPFCFDKTSDGEKENKEFPYAEEGICGAMEWFNEKSKEYNN